MLLAKQPFAGFNAWLGVTIGAMALFAAWVLASAAWSDSSARAMTEFDRSLLYLMALAFFGSLPRTPKSARWLLLGLAAAMVTICMAGFVTRTLPDVWAAPPERSAERWGYPIGYWNALGMAAAFALVFCLHLTCSARESKAVRLIAVTAMPVAASTLLFTFSRGPLAITAAGLVVYLVLARPRLAPTGLVAAVPDDRDGGPGRADHADFAARSGRGQVFKPLTGADLTEAHEVALTIAGCALAALLLRALGMLVFDQALARMRLRRRTKRRLALAAGGVAAAAVVVAIAVSLQNDRLQSQYDRLINDPVTQTGDQRDRLFNPGLNRVQRWDVALDAFAADPLTGNGAGTYRLVWERNRPNDENTNEAHSLYLETLGELGLVGAVLLSIVLLSALAALAWRMRGRGRSVHAALLTGALMWAVHAATDWDWELPVLTLWLFAAAGMALASEERSIVPGRVGWPVRIIVVVALLLLAITPARLAVSEARLGESLRDYRADRCTEAVAAADGSISVLGNLPEPYQVKGYCQARGGDATGAAVSLARAVDRDPGNWRYHYGLALALGLEGEDPRPASTPGATPEPPRPSSASGRPGLPHLAPGSVATRRQEASLRHPQREPVARSRSSTAS